MASANPTEGEWEYRSGMVVTPPEAEVRRRIRDQRMPFTARKICDVAVGAYVTPEEQEANGLLLSASKNLLSVAEGVLVALSYPRGSEAQVRCLEEVAQDAKSAIALARKGGEA